MDYNFPVIRTTHPKPRPEDESKLGFAKYFTDHMFPTPPLRSSLPPVCCTTRR